MYRLLWFLLVLPNIIPVSADTPKRIKKIGKPEVVCDSLPTEISETSGLIFFKNKLWTINDSGDGPYLYAIDTLGKAIIQKIKIQNAQNTDWEEIAQDDNHIYVGDFGNNYGLRNELTIYKIKKESIPDTGNTSIQASKIEFSYKNKPEQKKQNLTLSEYDCEAMTCISDTIILFSKNWKDSYCNIYLIPAVEGKYEIEPYKTIYFNGLITGASLSTDKTKLVLVGYRDFMPFVYVLNNFSIQNISTRKSCSKDFPLLTGYQTEGISYISNNEVIISSEYNILKSGILLKLRLK